jgi:hypothetical protein
LKPKAIANVWEQRNNYKEYAIGRVCSTHVSNEKCMGNLKGRDHLANLDVDVRMMMIITIKWILKIGRDDVDWINLAQDKVQWRDLVNIVMNLWVS